ncbi:hypothetical protein [Nocardioides sp. KR10-350]|uniref:hypothetical protein n=1 Tax=Nocardioides cheoyonin TaxID=3156615 RepID=UPI0032B5CC5A
MSGSRSRSRHVGCGRATFYRGGSRARTPIDQAFASPALAVDRYREIRGADVRRATDHQRFHRARITLR